MPENSKSNSRLQILDTLLNALPTFLAFAVPIFFLPITSEFFEFNKLTLVVISTVLMIVLWAIKMLVDKKVRVTKSPLDLPIIALVIVMTLATIFSLHKTSSLFGSQGRWFPSLFSALVLTVFYYIVAENISSLKTVRNAIYALLLGISISTFVALLGYYGISLGQAPYLQGTGFTLTGSITTTAILASLGTVLGLTALSNKSGIGMKLILVQLVALNFIGAILLGSTASWVVLGAGLLAFAYFVDMKKVMENKSIYLAVTGISLAFIIVMVTPATRNVLINEDYPSEIQLSPRESWIVSSSVMRDFPILGTGPSTFYLNYTRYKPASANATEYWNLRFDRPYNEAFGVIGSMGILGVIVGTALVIKTLNFTLNSKNDSRDTYTSSLLGVGTVALITSLLVFATTLTTMFILVLLVGLLVAQHKIESRGSVESMHIKLSSLSTSDMSIISTEKEVFQYIMAIPLFLIAAAVTFYMYKQYTGEYYMRQAVAAARENNGSLTYQMQQRAIRANPQRSSYHNSYANTSLALANTIASQEDLSEDERTTVQNLIAQAIRSAKVSTEVVNPLRAANWETRANIYSALSGVAENADTWAIDAYTNAIQLDPANPRLRLALGGIYYRNEEFLAAANQFNLATQLKGDYANAHYNLAQALKELENYNQALAELRIVQRLVDENSEDYQVVTEELAALRDLPAVAGAETQPTIEEIEAATEEENQTDQEPLTNVGEEQEEETLNVEDEEIVVDEEEQPQENETEENQNDGP